MDRQEAYNRARRQVRVKLGFYAHFFIYIAINVILIIVNLSTNSRSGYLWFIWPMLGWGIGVTSHGLCVFLYNSSIMQRMIDKEVEKTLEREAKKDP